MAKTRDLSRKQFVAQAKKFGFTPVRIDPLGMDYFDCVNSQGSTVSISTQPHCHPTHRARLAQLIRTLASINRRLENG